MIDLLFMFKFTLIIKNIESISLFVLSHLCEYCSHYYRAQKRVLWQLLGREVTNGVFPWPQTILKQLEEWHVIVSCNQFIRRDLPSRQIILNQIIK